MAIENGARRVQAALQPPHASIPFNRNALGQHLDAHGMSFATDQPVRQFAGGLANRNYLVIVDGRPLVLRRPPDGELPAGAHDMSREHRILSRLWRAFPLAPRSIHLCEDAEVLGVPFQLIEYRPGTIFHGADIGAFTGDAAVAEHLCETMISTLASIHRVSAASVDLGDLGRPTGFVDRAIDGWTNRGLHIATDPDTEKLVRTIGDWLRRQRFQKRAPTLLHCDFKLDNMIFDPQTLKPSAVIDWDMGTRGDPLFDLATTLSYWAEPSDPDSLRELGQMPTTQPGFWSREHAASRYAALTGTPLDDLKAMRVLATLKLGVVFLQLHEQGRRDSAADERYAAFGDRGRGILQLAYDIAEGTAH